MLESDVKTIFCFFCERKLVVCLYLNVLTQKRRKFSLKTKKDTAECRHTFYKRKSQALPVLLWEEMPEKVRRYLFKEVWGPPPPPSHDHNENVFLYILCNLTFPWRDDIINKPHLTQSNRNPHKLELGDLLSPGPVHIQNVTQKPQEGMQWFATRDASWAASLFPLHISYFLITPPKIPPPPSNCIMWRFAVLLFCLFTHFWWAARIFGGTSPQLEVNEQGALGDIWAGFI